MAALTAWVAKGIPREPEAWLYRVAHNNLMGDLRRDAARARILESVGDHAEVPAEEDVSAHFDGEVRDELLRMLFVCCSDEALPWESRLALALKTLCGFGTGEIALRLFTTEANFLPLRSSRTGHPTRTVRRGHSAGDASGDTSGGRHAGDFCPAGIDALARRTAGRAPGRHRGPAAVGRARSFALGPRGDSAGAISRTCGRFRASSYLSGPKRTMRPVLTTPRAILPLSVKQTPPNIRRSAVPRVRFSTSRTRATSCSSQDMDTSLR